MKQNDAPRDSAELDHQIEVALDFIGAVQHLGRFQRVGLSFEDALQEALEVEAAGTSGTVDATLIGTAGVVTPLSERELMEPEFSAVLGMCGWGARMAAIYNDGERWPHPNPVGRGLI